MPTISDRSTIVTVTNKNPLTVIADGATIANPCIAKPDHGFAVGDRIRVMIRTPQPPIAMEKVDVI